ncbi:MAG: hypothetical protein ACOYEV_12010 [Candidatus Nanopelagicales bacterium]
MSGEDVWVDARKGSTDYGSFKFSRAEVERRLRVAEYMKSAPTIDVGTTLMLRNGYHATVATVVGEDVWLDVEQDGKNLGKFKFPFGEVALAIIDNRPVDGSGIPDPAPASDNTPTRPKPPLTAPGQTKPQPEGSRVKVGATFTTGTGEEAVVRSITGNEVWVDVKTQGTQVALRFPFQAVEAALMQPNSTVNQEALTSLCGNGHSNPVSRRVCRECGSSVGATHRGSAPLTGAGVCVNGHHNPANRTTCRECSAPLPATELWPAAMAERAKQSRPTDPPAKSSPTPLAADYAPPQDWARRGETPTPGTDSPGPDIGKRAADARAWWTGLSTKLKLAVVGVPLVLIVLGVVIASTSRDENSYQKGRELSLVSTAGYKVGCGMGFCNSGGGDRMTPESECRHWIKHDYGDDVESQGLVLEDMVAGCLAGFGD